MPLRPATSFLKPIIFEPAWIRSNGVPDVLESSRSGDLGYAHPPPCQVGLFLWAPMGFASLGSGDYGSQEPASLHHERPPMAFPTESPASTTPITADQVYKNTPT